MNFNPMQPQYSNAIDKDTGGGIKAAMLSDLNKGMPNQKKMTSLIDECIRETQKKEPYQFRFDGNMDVIGKFKTSTDSFKLVSIASTDISDVGLPMPLSQSPGKVTTLEMSILGNSTLLIAGSQLVLRESQDSFVVPGTSIYGFNDRPAIMSIIEPSAFATIAEGSALTTSSSPHYPQVSLEP